MIKLLLTLILTISTTLSFAEECESRNHIFLIHGIGGDEKTFGSMDRYLNKINPCYSAQVFTYNTGKSDLSTYHFSEDLNQFIEKSLLAKEAKEKDKISLIMHSQGGIVGSLWLLQVKKENPDLYNRVDAFITLSTPYWGSTMAIVGDRFFFTLPENVDNPISPVGRIELKEMSFGSATIKAMQENFDAIFTDTHIRFLAVGGLKRNFNPHYGEDDTTVSVYSSRPDHYSYTEEVSITSENAETLSDAFSKTNSVPFIPVIATHFPIEIPGVANLEESCLKKEECNHPSIGHIMRHLQGEGPEPVDEKDFSFQKYRVQVFLDGWQGLVQKKDDVVVSLVKPHGEHEDVDFEIKRGGVLSATFSGILQDYAEKEISLSFKLKDRVIKVIKAPIKGGHSTFVNLKLVSEES